VALTAQPANLDFTRSAGAAIPQALLYNVYEGLVKLTSDGEIAPLLASAWTVSDDGLVYDFTLRSGVTFSNGDPFTAESVKFSLDRVATDWTANSPGYLDVVSAVEVVSETAVRITLATPSNSWLFNMTGPVGAMFTPAGVADLESTAIGTGPFVVDSWTPGTSLVLAANPDYWGEPAGMSSVTLRYFADATASSNALLAGDVDVVYALNSPQLVGQFEGDDAFVVTQGSTNGEVTLSMNNQRAPFDDVRVRQAVMHAIDRQAVIDTAYAGYGTLLGSMVPPTDPWFDEDLVELYPYDPEKAKELLAEAGVGELTVAFEVPNLPYATSVAQVVQAQLAEVGIDAVIEPLEFPAVWLDQVFTNKDYDLSVIQHSEPRDLTNFGNPSYYFGYDNPEVTALFASADAADAETYVADMTTAARMIAEDAAADWLFLFPLIVVADSGLTGLGENQTSLSLDLGTVRWS
jgi:peptide/nickel transport system substrate-binding protein